MKLPKVERVTRPSRAIPAVGTVTPTGEWKKPITDPREREVARVREERTRMHYAVDDAIKYASVTNLGIISEILRCCYLLIDARKDEDGSV